MTPSHSPTHPFYGSDQSLRAVLVQRWSFDWPKSTARRISNCRSGVSTTSRMHLSLRGYWSEWVTLRHHSQGFFGQCACRKVDSRESAPVIQSSPPPGCLLTMPIHPRPLRGCSRRCNHSLGLAAESWSLSLAAVETVIQASEVRWARWSAEAPTVSLSPVTTLDQKIQQPSFRPWSLVCPPRRALGVG